MKIRNSKRKAELSDDGKLRTRTVYIHVLFLSLICQLSNDKRTL